MLLHQEEAAAHDVVEVDDLFLAHAEPRVVEEFREQAAQTVRLVEDETFENAPVPLVEAPPAELLDRAPNRRERVLDLVGQRRGQRRHGFEPLRTDLQLPQPLEIGDVLEQRRGRGHDLVPAIEDGRADPKLHRRYRIGSPDLST